MTEPVSPTVKRRDPGRAYGDTGRDQRTLMVVLRSDQPVPPVVRTLERSARDRQ